MRPLAAAVLLVACAPAAVPPEQQRQPHVTTLGAAGGIEPAVRWPGGSRVAVVDPAAPTATRVLSTGLSAAGGPSVRWDGQRIAFTGKEGAADRFSVWTCAPDGSARELAVSVAGDCGAAAFLPDGRMVFAAESGGAWALFVSGPRGDAERITFSGGTDVDPTVLRDGRVAFASRAQGATEFALFSVHVDGTGVAPYGGPERTLVLLDAAAREPLAPRPRPQGHLSVVDPTKSTGDVFCVDARPPRGDGGGAERVRIVPLRGAPAPLGDVPLAADGSFFVRVPADVPLGLDLVDATGAVVAAQRSPFWVRPGETRGCIGCHEDADTAPPNVRPLAVLEEPVRLGESGPAGGSR